MFSELLKVILLGIVEGVTEFLPISSTGHLILVEKIAHLNDPHFAVAFDIFIQLGAILAVVYLFREKLRAYLKPDRASCIFWGKLFVAFAPAAGLGLLLHKKIETLLFFPLPVALALFVGGVLMIIIENADKNPNVHKIEEVSFKTAFYIGLAQCLSLWPGMSRAAATIMGGMLFGLTAAAAAEFSFLLAIPTMFAASGYALLKNIDTLSLDQALYLMVGFAVSFLVALFVVKLFIGYLQHRPLRPFAYYRIVLGLVIVALFLFA